MTKDEALRMALEALEYPLNISHEGFNVDMAELLAHRAITAIKEALQSNEQVEPVGEIGWAANIPNTIREVSWTDLCPPVGTKLYTTPPQRKPLSDEEIILIVAECASSHQHTDIHFARAIERAHGIKGLV